MHDRHCRDASSSANHGEGERPRYGLNRQESAFQVDAAVGTEAVFGAVRYPAAGKGGLFAVVFLTLSSCAIVSHEQSTGMKASGGWEGLSQFLVCPVPSRFRHKEQHHQQAERCEDGEKEVEPSPAHVGHDVRRTNAERERDDALRRSHIRPSLPGTIGRRRRT